MKGYSANLGFLWPDLPLLQRIEAAANAGFDAIELHWPYDTPAERVRAVCRSRNLTLLGLNTSRGNVDAGDNGLAAIPGREAEFRGTFEQALSYCIEAGGTAIHCMAGKVAVAERVEARDVLISNIREVAPLAGRYGLTILLEALNTADAPSYLYSKVADVAAVVAEVGASNVRIMYDAYHVGRGGGDVIAELENHIADVGHVQIASIPSRQEPSRENGPDYSNLVFALQRLRYEGWIGAEYRPAGSTDDGLEWRLELPNLTWSRANP